MREYLRFYIDGRWTGPVKLRRHDVINPATEHVSGHIALGASDDVDRAVAAARRAFEHWSESTREERLALLGRILEQFDRRADDLAAAVSEEMGAPAALAKNAQVALGRNHLQAAIRILSTYPFEEELGSTLIVREPIGVCGLITPWNWPINQIAVKVFPALAVGCTVVLKPSEVAPYSGHIFAEILDAAGTPAGVFNMIQGDGLGVGVPLSCHPDVDMISFTGSTRAGIEIAKNAAPTVKRVTQELGGKSANIVLDDADFARNVAAGVATMMRNTGQTCTAPSRMLVPRTRMDEAIAVARESASQVSVGPPDGASAMGPVVSRMQFDRVQGYIAKGIEEGADLVAGGPGRPEGLPSGYYVRPTVFANVRNDMTIAREEIFGPVLTILGYRDIEDAIRIANDTEFGLAGYVSGADLEQRRAIGRRLRSGRIGLSDGLDFNAAFGGYKRSGNGREWGEFGFHEYVEVKSILHYSPKASA